MESRARGQVLRQKQKHGAGGKPRRPDELSRRAAGEQGGGVGCGQLVRSLITLAGTGASPPVRPEVRTSRAQQWPDLMSVLPGGPWLPCAEGVGKGRSRGDGSQ